MKKEADRKTEEKSGRRVIMEDRDYMPIHPTEFYAHSLPGKPRSERHKLEEYLKSTAELARKFAECFKSDEWTWNAGWLHDSGKATNAFQRYLARSNGLDDSEYDADGSQSNHASAGAALAEEKLGVCVGRILADLADRGLILSMGVGRGIYYVLPKGKAESKSIDG